MFEGIRFYDTPQGSAIFCLDEHLNRLFYSAETLKMNIPYSKSEITAAVIETIKANHLTKGYIRPLIYYRYERLGVNPKDIAVDFIIAAWQWDHYLPLSYADVKISRFRRIPPSASPVDAKLCGNYVNGILAATELKGTAYHEALLLDERGYIAEGVSENFFMYKNGILYTPKLGYILPGITRKLIMRLAQEEGITVEETDLLPENVYKAEEAFFTGTAVEIVYIRSINDHVFNKGKIGVITAQLKEKYLNLVHGQRLLSEKHLTVAR